MPLLSASVFPCLLVHLLLFVSISDHVIVEIIDHFSCHFVLVLSSIDICMPHLLCSDDLIQEVLPPSHCVMVVVVLDEQQSEQLSDHATDTNMHSLRALWARGNFWDIQVCNPPFVC